MEEKLNRIEEHMLQLISMVAENNKITKEIVIRMDNQERKFDIEKQLNAP